MALQKSQIFSNFTSYPIGVFNTLFFKLGKSWQITLARNPRPTWVSSFLQPPPLPCAKSVNNPPKIWFSTLTGGSTGKPKTQNTMKKTMVLVVAVIVMASCSVTRTSVGSFPPGKPPAETFEVYDRKHQGYVIRGIIPTGLKQVKLPPEGNYQIKTSTRFIDGLLGALTFGIYTQQTIEVLIMKK